MAKFKTARKKNKLKISACYIVKNNAADLEISLRSLKKYVDEIIVTDTGSTDDTVKVAEKFGAKIFHYEWNDDFAAARNFALSKVSGDTIIFLDADEFFTNLTAKNIRPVIERAAQAKKNALLINLVNIDRDNGNKILDDTYCLRIFKNLPGLHYVGKIHEELRVGEKNISEVVFVPQDVLQIFHTGYSTSISREKAERNLKMLLAELEETNEPQRIYGYIAECYDGLGDSVNAEKFARLDIGSGKKNTTFESTSYRIMLKILARDSGRTDERKIFAEKAVEDFPDLPEFVAELAECNAVAGDFKKAIELGKTALKKFENYRQTEPTTFDAESAKFLEQRIKLWSAR